MNHINKKSQTIITALTIICITVALTINTADAAVYCMSQCEKIQQTDLYQEVIVVESGASLYTAQQHGAGYLGFYGGADTSKNGINFSIWDNKKNDRNFVVEAPDARIGGSVERFGNEGTGAKTRTFFKWEQGVYYKTYIKTEHIDGGTLWSGWVGRADEKEWYSLGRIYVPNSKQWTGNGGIFLETLSDHTGTTKRENGIRLGWSKDATGWAAHSGFTWSCQKQHLPRASGYQAADNSVRLVFQKGKTNPWHPKTRNPWPAKGRDGQGPLKPSPANAPTTMSAYKKPVVDISACPTENSIPKKSWKLHYVDSEETRREKAGATNAFDNDFTTYWHTAWNAKKPPHEIQIDLGANYEVNGFGYQAREGGSMNGTIATYEFYVSTDGKNWSKPVASGAFNKIAGIGQTVNFKPVNARYIRLVAITEINNQNHTSASEIFVYEKRK